MCRYEGGKMLLSHPLSSFPSSPFFTFTSLPINKSLSIYFFPPPPPPCFHQCFLSYDDRSFNLVFFFFTTYIYTPSGPSGTLNSRQSTSYSLSSAVTWFNCLLSFFRTKRKLWEMFFRGNFDYKRFFFLVFLFIFKKKNI